MAIEQYRPGGFKLLPEVTKNLLIVNGLFFLATYVLNNQGIDLTDTLGLHYPESEKFRLYQFITYMFMHGGVMHIAVNMFALWMFGAAVENVWGPRKFLVFYLFAGLGAAVTHFAVVYFEMQPGLALINDYLAHPGVDKLQALMQSQVFTKYSSPELAEHYNDFIGRFNSTVNVDSQKAIAMSVDAVRDLKTDLLNAPVVVGASGAIFGLLLAYGMLFPDSYIYVYFFLPLKAKYFVIIYGAMELFSGVNSRPGDNVAHFAHLGGLLFGFILIMYWRWQNQKRRNDFFNP